MLEIGTAEGVGDKWTGIYIGPVQKLRGKIALVRASQSRGYVVVQFNDADTGYGYGWWRFPAVDFETLLNRLKQHIS
jgi:hypothetical protein